MDERINMKFDINSLIENYFPIGFGGHQNMHTVLRNRTPTKSNKNDLQCQFFSNDTQGADFFFVLILPPPVSNMKNETSLHSKKNKIQ